MTLTEKIKLAVNSALGTLGRKAVCIPLTVYVVSKVFAFSKAHNPRPTTDLLDHGFTRIVIVLPIIEELFFRHIIQKVVIQDLQKFVGYLFPNASRNSPIVRWLNSPSCRIFVAQLAFAGLHLLNGGGYLSGEQAVVQTIIHLLYPITAILAETTDEVETPILCHMSINLICFTTAKISNYFHGRG